MLVEGDELKAEKRETKFKKKNAVSFSVTLGASIAEDRTRL